MPLLLKGTHHHSRQRGLLCGTTGTSPHPPSFVAYGACCVGLLAVTTGLLALLVAMGEEGAALALAVGEAAEDAWPTAAL